MSNGKIVVLPTKRGLSERQAAAYVGVSLETFRAEVARGIWPGPRLHGRKRKKKVWDKRALDLAYDRVSGIGPGEAEHEAAALAALDRRYGRKVS
jgi:hypothetical protein